MTDFEITALSWIIGGWIVLLLKLYAFLWPQPKRRSKR